MAGDETDRDGNGQRPLTRRQLRNQREHDGIPRTSSPVPVSSGISPATVRPPTPAPESASEAFSLNGLFASVPNEPAAAERTEPDILFVCTGNICRSALGEIALAERLSDLAVHVHSAGTHALVGHGMPEQAQALATAHGVGAATSAAHRARLLTEEHLRDADLVLTMTSEHSTHALELHPSALSRVFPVRTLARLSSSMTDQELTDAADSGGGAPRSRLRAMLHAIASKRASAPPAIGDEDVIDPYRRPTAVYELAAEQLIPAVDEIARVVRIAAR